METPGANELRRKIERIESWLLEDRLLSKDDFYKLPQVVRDILEAERDRLRVAYFDLLKKRGEQ